MRISISTIVILVLFTFNAGAQKVIALSSPDNNIQFQFQVFEGMAMYSVAYKKTVIIDQSRIGLTFSQGAFNDNLKAGKVTRRQGEESYQLVVGKVRTVKERFNEVVIPIEETENKIRVNFVVRAFNDGVAFRYEFQKIPGQTTFELRDENTSFTLRANPAVLTMFLDNYTTSHEGLYTKSQLGDLTKNKLMALPSLFEFPGTVYLAITEAALLDYAGMYLMKERGILRSMLSPLPSKPGVKVTGTLPHKSPWRVLMISDRIGALIESNIITNLNEPNRIKDTGWIRPGKTTFPWWNGNIVSDTITNAGNNFITQKYHIDFCARNGLEYHSVVEHGSHQWYQDDGENFQPGRHPDVTKPVAGLDMKEVCDYAHSKGVDVRVWVHWAALYPKLDSAFAQFERWGLSGMMIDFMDRDDQDMVNIQTEMLEKAAKHKLHVQFHGAYKPTGLHRTYPNEFTREGTLNYETNKWDSLGLSPDHDINIPFTRMLAGSTDYHLGGFRAVPREEFKAQYSQPLMLGTRCHMLAMYVVLESYLGMVCDYPEAYEGQPGFDFITKVPTVWDETRVIDARVGEFVVIARRKDKDWFIGGITNSSARELSIPLSFLSDGTFTATITTDSPNDPNGVIESVQQITRQSKLNVKLEPGGGVVVHITK
ncbi:MAG TPA: glycoside hydrolase family 97 protein [Anaerolineales bacterium]|nr:glycoside hydrolase family 97 protein [Anaerolineales bacterium]